MTDVTTPTNNPDFDVQDQEEMAEINDFDFDRVSKLLAIMEKVATVAPRNTHLLGIAQAELTVLNDKARDIARRRADRIKEAEQRRFEAEQERVRREQEAQDNANRPVTAPETQLQPADTQAAPTGPRAFPAPLAPPVADDGDAENEAEAEEAYADEHAEAEQVEPPPQPGMPSPQRRL